MSLNKGEKMAIYQVIDSNGKVVNEFKCDNAFKATKKWSLVSEGEYILPYYSLLKRNGKIIACSFFDEQERINL